MNKKLSSSAFLAMTLAAKASAQVYNQGIIGYESSVFLVGSNLFNNPFDVGSANSLNTLDILFPSNNYEIVPEGTTVSLWDPTSLTFEATSTFTNGAWSLNLTLPPGTGALVVTPSQFTNTISGLALNHDGSLLGLAADNPPPLFTGPNGVYLLGDKTAISDTGTDIFLNILGRFPYPGEKVASLSGTSTYLGNGNWDSIPQLKFGESAFLFIASESPPELTIVYANNQAVVSWPPTVSGWTLQTNADLNSNTWGNYTGPVANNAVTNMTPAGTVFYRLFYP